MKQNELPPVYVREGYTAQPIPSDPKREQKNKLPEKIRQMKELPISAGSGIPAFYFYRQASFMADYTDDYVYEGVFHHYYPTYTAMTDAQLRGYFGWRTRFRMGRPDPDVSISFVYVYVYEILGGIGLTPDEGYAELRKIDSIYGTKDAGLHHNLRVWTGDYIAYYDLKPEIARAYFEEEQDGALAVLENFTSLADTSTEADAAGDFAENVPANDTSSKENFPETLPEDTDTRSIFAAICALSTYSIEKSPYVKKNPDDAADAYAYVLYGLAGLLRREHRSFVARYFGTRDIRYYQMFRSAVFYDRKKYQSYTYVCSGVRIYHCVQGQWSVENYTHPGKSTDFGRLCREIDRQLRLQMHAGRPLKESGLDMATAEAVADLIGQWIRLKQEAARPRVQIDMSALAGIRQDAAVTRDSLLVDEEETQESEPEQESVPEYSLWEKDHPTEAYPAGLSGEEAAFLHVLLYGGDWKAFLQEHHLMASMLADSINEKMLDEIGDTVITFDGDTPELVEDYLDDLKALLPQ